MTGPGMARVVNPVTAQQEIGMIKAWGCELITPSTFILLLRHPEYQSLYFEGK
jgi:hypothetical protein